MTIRSTAQMLLEDEKFALYDDATSSASRKRLENLGLVSGNSITFVDGSSIEWDPLSGSVTATGIENVISERNRRPRP